MKKAFLSIVVVLFFCASQIFAQSVGEKTEQSSKKKLKEVLFFDGYLKNMQSYNFTTNPIINLFTAGIADSTTNAITGNLWHNRLNFEFIPNNKFTAAIELRNQIYIGEQYKTTANFAENLKTDNGFLQMKFNLFENNFSVFNTQIDRLWMEYQNEKWLLKVGRQRINWGINLIWNPNDIFNSYNYLDFDYEERPGTDAIKLTYFPSYDKNFEFVYQPNSNFKNDSLINNELAGLKFGFNIKNYDVQLLTAYNPNEITFGLGFAGNVKNGSLKSEFTFFQPLKNNLDDNFIEDFNFSIGYDNITESGIFYQIGYLYNGNGFNSDNLLELSGNFNLGNNSNNLSAKNIFPFKSSFLIGGTYSLNPRLNANFASIIAPKPFTIILTPSISYSIAQNWDFDIFVQSFFMNGNFGLLAPNNKMIHFTTSGNFRIKWNF